jgi:hypothetical protein
VQQVLGALVGVPATILVAGGLGLMGVAVFQRIASHNGEPTRWASIALGFLMLVVGAFLIELEILLFGTS